MAWATRGSAESNPVAGGLYTAPTSPSNVTDPASCTGAIMPYVKQLYPLVG